MSSCWCSCLRYGCLPVGKGYRICTGLAGMRNQSLLFADSPAKGHLSPLQVMYGSVELECRVVLCFRNGTW